MAKRKAKNAHLVEPTWGRVRRRRPAADRADQRAAGPLSPFGEDHGFPLPLSALRYAHPTDKPNRAGVQLVEGR